jgi:hypothetical protein
MSIVIEQVKNRKEKAAIWWIRQQVFKREMGLAHARLSVPETPESIHLLARIEQSKEPVGALSVIDTSGNHQLHERYGLKFGPFARVARYTQLAVLRPYRGIDIPLRLMIEAHRLFIVPGGFDYTWLLFDAERSALSSLCRRLAFTPSAQAFLSDFGLTRVLVRDEHTISSKRAVRQTEQYLDQCSLPFSPDEPQFAIGLNQTA